MFNKRKEFYPNQLSKNLFEKNTQKFYNYFNPQNVDVLLNEDSDQKLFESQINKENSNPNIDNKQSISDTVGVSEYYSNKSPSEGDLKHKKSFDDRLINSFKIN